VGVVKILSILLFVISFTEAKYLKKEYFVTTDTIYLSTITKDKKNDAPLYRIERDRYLKRVRAKDLLRKLKEHGYRYFKADISYVTFVKESPIDTEILKEQIARYYKKNYASIDIKDIKIISKNRLKTLPKEFSLKIQPSALLRSHATFSIKTAQMKQYFFEYFIDAHLYVYKSKRKIQKGEMLNGRNLTRNYVMFDRFRALPLQKYTHLQAKHHINKGHIITVRDVKKADLVKRGAFVTVKLKQGTMEISFSAKALQAGSLHDIILIQNSHGKKIRAEVVGKNMVEVEALQ